MTTREVAALAGVTVRTVQRAVVDGQIKAEQQTARGQREWVLDEASAREWAASDRRPGRKPASLPSAGGA